MSHTFTERISVPTYKAGTRIVLLYRPRAHHIINLHTKSFFPQLSRDECQPSFGVNCVLCALIHNQRSYIYRLSKKKEKSLPLTCKSPVENYVHAGAHAACNIAITAYK